MENIKHRPLDLSDTADVFHHTQGLTRKARERGIKEKARHDGMGVTVAGLGNCRRYAIVEAAVSVTLWKQCRMCLRAERHYSALLRRAAREQYA